MRFEIAIHAAPFFLDLLSKRILAAPEFRSLPSLSVVTKNEKMPALFLLAVGPKTMDAALILVSREMENLEKSLSMKPGEAKLSVRNMEYGEPAPAFSHSSPFRPASYLTVYPWNGEPPVGHPSSAILLDSFSAFGSGTHPTTILCLSFLEEMGINKNTLASLDGKAVLDFGCGTGILAIASVKLGALRADGVEIDHDAAQTALRNVCTNRLDEKIAIMEGSLDTLTGTYGIIMANLVAAAHMRVGRGLPEHLNPAGHLLVSGFSVSQTAQIEKIYKEYVLEVIERREKEGWAAVLFHKP